MIKEISDSDVENGKTVVYNHLVSPLTREGALESLLFCIASQAWRWEKANFRLAGILNGNVFLTQN